MKVRITAIRQTVYPDLTAMANTCVENFVMLLNRTRHRGGTYDKQGEEMKWQQME